MPIDASFPAINASLAAHILSDADISGSLGLQGNQFKNTVSYLQAYITYLKKSGAKTIPVEYNNLLSKMAFLLEVEDSKSSYKVFDKLKILTAGDSFFIPGGWQNSGGGHAMVYKFTRLEKAYQFTVYNAGDGIQYHATKSSPEKELYNPKKAWTIPLPADDHELRLFIERLIRPLNIKYHAPFVDAEKLYQHIFSSIAYVKGEEIDQTKTIDQDAWTGSQLSGTCSMRVLHQLLKMDSEDLPTYQRFIFGFKEFALNHYIERCKEGSEPFTPGVLAQINLALDNNLKIVNIPNLFPTDKKEAYAKRCMEIKSELAGLAFINNAVSPKEPNTRNFHLSDWGYLNYTALDFTAFNFDKTTAPDLDLSDGKDLLNKLQQAVAYMITLKDPAQKYKAIETLLLSLPIGKQDLTAETYGELSTEEHFIAFQTEINKIADIMSDLSSTWLDKTQDPGFTILTLSMFALQTDAYDAVTQRAKQPSFVGQSSSVLRGLVQNQHRNAFLATNNPKLDQRLKDLEHMYDAKKSSTEKSYTEYFQELLNTEPELRRELENRYAQAYGQSADDLHKYIQKHHFRALFMLLVEMKRLVPDEKLNPIRIKLAAHFEHENRLRRLINPLYQNQRSIWEVSFQPYSNAPTECYLNSNFMPWDLNRQPLSKSLLDSKYPDLDSPIRDILSRDLPESSYYEKPIRARSANAIQLVPLDSNKAGSQISSQDILAREYEGMRTNPQLQVSLTLSHFTRAIDKLADKSMMRFVEANLFQPGVLLSSLSLDKQNDFLKQFDAFITTGLNTFTQNGLYQTESLFFVRLNYLVNRYIALSHSYLGNRLEQDCEHLSKHLKEPNSPEVSYVLNQYLFLSLMTRIEAQEDSTTLLEQAYEAFFYCQTHSNPHFLEDKSQCMAVEQAVIALQQLICKMPEKAFKEIFDRVLASSELTKDKVITGNFPEYEGTVNGSKVCTINALLGTVFQNGLAKSSLPLVLQNHPLVKRLGLDKIKECYRNASSTYFELKDGSSKVKLFYNTADKSLTVQKEWLVAGKPQFFQLGMLNLQSPAYLANKSLVPPDNILPKSLTDGHIDYWKNVSSNAEPTALLTDNKNIQFILHPTIKDINQRTLINLPKELNPTLKRFEDPNFVVPLANDKGDLLIDLPRYGLNLAWDPQTQLLTTADTKECVLQAELSPIDPRVAGLVLQRERKKNKFEQRYLVPIARFYAQQEIQDTADKSGNYPIVHDVAGKIADECLSDNWRRNPPKITPQWYYQNSESYVSFKLVNGKPKADSVADTLYLAYLYLATDHPTDAWDLLNSCGDLTGKPEELQYIRWICEALPHVLPSFFAPSQETQDKPKRNTAPYVACRLKALSMLCKHLNAEKGFDTPKTEEVEGSANAEYARLQQQDQERFLQTLPQTIYRTYDRGLRLNRHVDARFMLKDKDNKCLLDYYHQATAVNGIPQPKGTLGLVWQALEMSALLQEEAALLAQKTADGSMTAANASRLEAIGRYRRDFKAVTDNQTELALVDVNLSLPSTYTFKTDKLAINDREAWEKWQNRPFAWRNKCDQASLIRLLSYELKSDISEAAFLGHFLDYLEAAAPGNWTTLTNFCAATLLTNRHLPFARQESNIPILCNLLYRVLNNNERFKTFMQDKVGKTLSLDDLMDEVRTYPVKPLQVYEIAPLKTITLETTEKTLERLTAKPAQPHKVLQAKVTPAATLINKASLEDTLNKYRQLDLNGQKAIQGLSEDDAGKLLFGIEQQQTALAETVDVAGIKEAALLKAAALETQVQAAWELAKKLANEGPEDKERALSWQLEKDSHARAPIDKAMLKSLYTQADAAFSIEKTGLSLQKVEDLHQAIHEALVLGVQFNTATRVAKNLAKFEKKKTKGQTDLSLISTSLELLSKAHIPNEIDPAMLLLQHEESLLLRNRQEQALTALLSQKGLGFAELIEKIIMGGGKSKVLLPILAEKKARGDNLVVIEVPQALLPTNHAELNRTSQKLYGKEAVRFEFNRDSNCSAARLKQIYRQFIDIMNARAYMVTTGESIQSLELKYLELLLIPQKERTADWKDQIYWADKIVSLFRNHADCMIDEVHQGLWINKKLNYTSGESRPLAPSLIRNATALYSLIELDFIKAAQNNKVDFDWTSFKEGLAKKLTEDAQSPLKSFIARAKVLHKNKDLGNHVYAYLLNKADTTFDKVLAKASDEDKASLAYFKEQINTLLPYTLARRLNEHYGASKLPGLTPVQKTLAIPYAANNVPNERSRFGNELEAMNFTIQKMLLEGISRDQLRERILAWQLVARREMLKDRSISNLEDTPTAQGFALRVGTAFRLSQLSVDNTNDMDKLHAFFQHDTKLIFELLQTQSLSQIRREKAVIHSDAFNHADLYRSLQGMSGTPDNQYYHQRLQYNAKTSLGTDAYILEVLKAKNKNTKIIGLEYNNVSQYVKACLAINPLTRALIDIKASFKGVDNLTVAKTIAAELKGKDIKHVLYFNEEQQLCALLVDNPEVSIVLGSSDVKVLNDKLGSKPSQRFTYYDQVHTLGTDITQTDNAHALVLVDEHISLASFLQGVMRMRLLAQGQTVDLVVPPALKDISFDNLIAEYKRADKLRHTKDAPTAAQGMMDNIGRREALERILTLPSDKADDKAKLAAAFADFFVDTPSADLAALYGGLAKLDDADNILTKHKTEIITAVTDKFKAAGFAQPPELNKALDDIIKAIKPQCAKQYEVKTGAQGREVELQKAVQKQVACQVAVLNECYDRDRKEEELLDWPWISCNDDPKITELSLPLNDLCEDQKPFSPSFRVSKNYAKTYQDQDKYLGAFVKPVFLIWYRKVKDKLEAILITQEEYTQLKNYMSFDLKESWIATTDDAFIAGDRPSLEMLNDIDYQSLREQARFFNGELDTIANQKTAWTWLKENTAEKLAFFETELLPYRPDSGSGLMLLEELSHSNNQEVYHYIAKHPFMEYTPDTWQEIAPEAPAAQVAVFESLTQAFSFMNGSWLSHPLDVNALGKQFNLPIQAYSYLNTHVKQLDDLKTLVTTLQKTKLDKAFTTELSVEQQACLEKCLKVSLTEFYAEQGQQDLIETNLKLLNTLSESPVFQKAAVSFDDCIQTIITRPDGLKYFETITLNQKLSEKLVILMMKQAHCPLKLAKTLLARLAKPEEDLLVILVDKCSSPEDLQDMYKISQTKLILEAILAHKALSPAIITELLTKFDTSPAELQLKILEKTLLSTQKSSPETLGAWETCLDQLLKKMPETALTEVSALIEGQTLSPKLGFLFLQRFGKALSTKLPLKEMIGIATAPQLTLLAPGIETNLLPDLAAQCQQGSLIDTLLARPDMDAVIAETLLHKPDYSGLVGDWPWLSEAQCITLLDKANDFASFERALSHTNLTAKARDAWLTGLEETHEQSRKADLASNNPQLVLETLLEDLRLKAFRHAIVASDPKQSQYLDAAKTAFGLYQGLQQNILEHFVMKTKDKAQFQADTQSLIAGAKPVLNEHRGFKQVLVDIFNVILYGLTLGIGSQSRGTWRFFVVDTATMAMANDFDKEVVQCCQ